jgi:hypothetical protein
MKYFQPACEKNRKKNHFPSESDIDPHSCGKFCEKARRFKNAHPDRAIAGVQTPCVPVEDKRGGVGLKFY